MASTFDPVAFYQSLPDLEHAVLTLSTVDFDKLLEKVTDLLRPYGDKYGLCLLHRHFPLFKDEIMVESGNVMQPTLKTGDGQFYEKRWDRFGRAYEYSVGEQEIIPVQLLQDFREIVPKSTSLGIYSRKGDDETVQWMEYTDPEFRTHTNRPRTEESDDAPQTACYSKDGQPLTRGCGGTCRKNNVRSGTVVTHTVIEHPPLK
ncbi:hypothetical protein V865_003304 [Kwoniella europaea PYCC6329]|uniref:Uncharacterized protein n=1 Tax=Kwoniella europaea PYCC6329 TaxID=1423913 RepID=A0AAX4KF78_9TREE